MNEQAEQLANEHWKYIEGILKAHEEEEYVIRLVKYHYLTAFVHGYKHRDEEVTNNTTWQSKDAFNFLEEVDNCGNLDLRTCYPGPEGVYGGGS